jgi:hypothetical protein
MHTSSSIIKPNKHIDESRDKSLIYLALGKGLRKTGAHRKRQPKKYFLFFIGFDDKAKPDKPSSLYGVNFCRALLSV